ncbi:hypothetical protein Bca52824_033067 [Brassica carinata]|uniref:Uncharacterized protein n=1 Tax=Brassica carinata TaxID=52824 RepID=A0A8X7V953_BRACI|nr:hypothetical protein Bca52824_033067 [Brassica carinata]
MQPRPRIRLVLFASSRTGVTYRTTQAAHPAASVHPYGLERLKNKVERPGTEVRKSRPVCGRERSGAYTGWSYPRGEDGSIRTATRGQLCARQMTRAGSEQYGRPGRTATYVRDGVPARERDPYDDPNARPDLRGQSNPRVFGKFDQHSERAASFARQEKPVRDQLRE